MNQISTETLNINLLLARATPVMVKTGQTDFRQDAAEMQLLDKVNAIYSVRGNDPIPYEVIFSFRENRLEISCDCPHVDGDPSMICSHKITAALALNQRLHTQTASSWRTVLSSALTHIPPRAAASPRTMLLFSLSRDVSGWRVTPYALATRHLPEGIWTDPRALADTLTASELARHARVIRTRADFTNYVNATPELIAAVNLLLGAFFHLQREHMDTLLPLLAKSPFFRGTGAQPFHELLTISPIPGAFALEVTRAPQGLRLTSALQVNGQPSPLRTECSDIISEHPVWLLSGTTVLRLDTTLEMIRPFLLNPELIIPAGEQEEFLQRFLLPLVEQVPLRGDAITWEECAPEPVRRLYLSETAGELRAQLRFGYADIELPYAPQQPAFGIHRYPNTCTIVRVYRRIDVEEEAARALTSHGLKRGDAPGWFSLRKDCTAVDLLLRQVPRLQEAGFEVFGEEALRSVRVNHATPTLSLTISTEIDWFDLRAMVQFGGQEVALKEIRRALRRCEQYVKLPDGTIGYLPDEWLTRYRPLLGLGEETEHSLRLTRAQVMLLDSLINDADQAQVDDAFTECRRQLQEFTQITRHELPHGFTGELRPYQWAGYNWLHFLHEYNFGGCLADDMGIGKTIQTLTFLQSLHENAQSKKADLIVMPRTLLGNWQREAERFTPNLRLYLHAEMDRLQDPALFDKYDLVLTTYGVMLRDLELLRHYHFHYLVLDESQMIKNPQSQTAKAARMLLGEHRLVLTGTPVENTTVDLWSQFSFLNPGLLGSLDYFRSEFSLPIEKKGDENAARLLRKMVYPFILRRTKEQVETELPPRTERILYCEMESAQRKLYTRERDHYRSLLLGMIDGEGMNSARMHVLEGLLRLRQICNHPRLLETGFKGESAKFELLLDTLETLRAEGHKALIFSQFTRMLALLCEALDARRIPYEYLDGSTKNRQRHVDAFQQDPLTPFFLISLKAGGVGLNLTAADYVIHIDPWWNPAVERQATDRSHRIGQTKPVFVYKLIANDSVEEKILQLQERKHTLMQQLISSEESFFKKLTRGDVEELFS